MSAVVPYIDGIRTNVNVSTKSNAFSLTPTSTLNFGGGSKPTSIYNNPDKWDRYQSKIKQTKKAQKANRKNSSQERNNIAEEISTKRRDISYMEQDLLQARRNGDEEAAERIQREIFNLQGDIANLEHVFKNVEMGEKLINEDLTGTIQTYKSKLENLSKSEEKYIPVRDYSITYDNIDKKLDWNTIIANLHKTLHLPDDSLTFNGLFKRMTEKYNRFKIADPNLSLSKGFAHVFFVKPCCNILDQSGTKLSEGIGADELFEYFLKTSPELLKELSDVSTSSHSFMLSLSNAVTEVSLNDEGIDVDEYGAGYTGYKIAYGKHNVRSKTAGSIQFHFTDTRNLSIYQLHKLWVEYISGVYRGIYTPNEYYLFNKILDYTSACYYILTAEDGETIIFWSKYYGLFPADIPSSQYSWGSGNVLTRPELDIKYMYSFKEDCKISTIMEFNYNAGVTNKQMTYVPNYDPKLGHSGETWVGVPFIEIENDPSGIDPYVYKLRFTAAEEPITQGQQS